MQFFPAPFGASSSLIFCFFFCPQRAPRLLTALPPRNPSRAPALRRRIRRSSPCRSVEGTQWYQALKGYADILIKCPPFDLSCRSVAGSATNGSRSSTRAWNCWTRRRRGKKEPLGFGLKLILFTGLQSIVTHMHNIHLTLTLGVI